MHLYIIVNVCIMEVSKLKLKHLRFAANHQEGRVIDIRSFYITCLGKCGVKILLCISTDIAIAFFVLDLKQVIEMV